MVTKLLTDVVVEFKATGTFSVFSMYLNVSLNNIDIRRDSRSCKNPGIGHMGRGSREGNSQRVCLGVGPALTLSRCSQSCIPRNGGLCRLSCLKSLDLDSNPSSTCMAGAHDSTL